MGAYFIRTIVLQHDQNKFQFNIICYKNQYLCILKLGIKSVGYTINGAIVKQQIFITLFDLMCENGLSYNIVILFYEQLNKAKKFNYKRHMIFIRISLTLFTKSEKKFIALIY